MSKMESTPPYYCDVKIKIDVKFINIKERNGKMTYTSPKKVNVKLVVT